ncbi:MAG: aminotransferase class III-fold pyridoxal phosphate-dependent enzyme, partial [Calditrichaeota bacterium]|nr:aminotransferase class III-fold pyridoxal phosphate-dependent enzyme [Calditrichota bacterium]
DITPDMMALAKPIAGGLPMGAVLLNDMVAGFIQPGNHGSTFGGGPLVASVAEHIVRRIAQPQFLQHIEEMSEYFFAELESLKKNFNKIVSIRGKGLMIGVELDDSPQPLINACAENGLLVCKTGGNAFRLLPPLIIEKEHVDEAIEKLTRAFREVI